MTPRLDGIDTSSNQPLALNTGGYDEAIEQGAWFAFEKATQGAGYRNPLYPRRREIIAEKFEKGGAYHWVSHGVPIAAQLRNFKGYVGALWKNEGVQVDAEEGGITEDEVVEVATAFWDEYEGRVVLYTPVWMIQRVQDRLPAGMKFWLPWYDDPWERIAGKLRVAGISESDIVVWQWGGGKQGVYLPSLGARVDSNLVRDPVAFRRICGGTRRAPVELPNQEDEVTDDDIERLRGVIHDEAFAAVIQVLRSTEVQRIIWQQARSDAPFPPDPQPA